MSALLHALGASSPTRAWQRVVLAMGVLAAGAGAVWAYGSYARARRIAACEVKGDEVATVWNDERRQALSDAVVGTGASDARTTVDKTMPWLDAQAEQWRQARVETCLDADVRARWDPQMAARSLWCLDERLMQLDSLVGELTAADAEVTKWAVTAATGLASVAPCRDEEALVTQVPPPEGQIEEVRAVRASVTRVGTLEQAGRFEAGLELARAAVERAEALGWQPLSAAARFRLGVMLQRTGAFAEAEAALEAAYFEAIEAGLPEVAFDAATELVWVVGVERGGRDAEGLRWGRHAEMALRGAHDGQGLRRATLFNHLAGVYFDTSRYDEAVAALEAALAIRQAALGPDHPELALLLNNIGMIRQRTGALDEAKTLIERALATGERTLGPEHPNVISSTANLASVHLALGNHAEAKRLYERALAIGEETLGPEHPRLLTILDGLATVHEAQAAPGAARPLLERALSIGEKALGPEHPNVAHMSDSLAHVLRELGAYDEATVLYERAIAVYERSVGPDDPVLAYPLVGLAELSLARSRPGDAIAPAERAVSLRETHGVTAGLAAARFVLAQALWDAPEATDHDRARAIALAEQARAAWRRTEGDRAARMTEVEKWLEGRAAP